MIADVFCCAEDGACLRGRPVYQTACDRYKFWFRGAGLVLMAMLALLDTVVRVVM